MTNNEKLNAIDAINAMCSLTKMADMFEDIGINIESSSEQSVGHYLYSSMDIMMNIIARCCNEDTGNEGFEHMIQNFVDERSQTINEYKNDDVIKSFVKTHLVQREIRSFVKTYLENT